MSLATHFDALTRFCYAHSLGGLCEEAELMVEPMMTARQVAEVLGVHENWVYDQAVGGDLPSYKIGGARRFQPDEVLGWIAAHREARRERQAQNRTARAVSETSVAPSTDARAKLRKSEMQQPKQTPTASAETASAPNTSDPQPQLFDA
jgi:excisionase family DNA binding protein